MDPTSRAPGPRWGLILALVAVGLVAIGVAVWAAMPMFGPMPGMGH